MTFGVSHALANPGIGCGCDIVLRDGKTVATFTGSNVEHIEITRAESGNVNANCKVDLGKGSEVKFDFTSTGFPCFINGVATNDWQEVISASGQTTLSCHIKH